MKKPSINQQSAAWQPVPIASELKPRSNELSQAEALGDLSFLTKGDVTSS